MVMMLMGKVVIPTPDMGRRLSIAPLHNPQVILSTPKETTLKGDSCEGENPIASTKNSRKHKAAQDVFDAFSGPSKSR